MAKRGPKPKVIDWEKFEFACSLLATLDETSGLLGVSPDTLEARVKDKYGKKFNEVLNDLSGQSRVSLRRTQFKMAQTNPTMAIWLGKQWLGQTDKVMAQNNDTKDDENFRNAFFGFHPNGNGKHYGRNGKNGHKNGNGEVK